MSPSTSKQQIESIFNWDHYIKLIFISNRLMYARQLTYYQYFYPKTETGLVSETSSSYND